MNSEILSYLSELSTKDTKKFLENIRLKKLLIKIKFAESDKIESVELFGTNDPNIYKLSIRKDLELNGQIATFKIQVGTDIYFLKTKIWVRDKSHTIQTPFQVFKLVRRKTTRYLVPENWPQAGMILATQKRMQTTKLKIIEISTSGLRMHVLSEIPRYEKEQNLKIQFKLFRRSDVTVTAVVRHVKYNYQGGQLLGVEFVQESMLTRNKIQNICEDLVHSLS